MPAFGEIAVCRVFYAKTFADKRLEIAAGESRQRVNAQVE